ncbi:M48 family metallopeptidase [Frigidibacter mobilis]|uniref:Peptidase M48, Ste24p n=1 Tax=Frigidibacter mobilis TaxID=1335048 RepID=A0A159Z0N4_9RHOB|nr:M48 family metallopeptidase [Frigidibacter mobilis]AMY68435.1 peptidase M48, Ste24p [Frigidibacter mobilis]
MRCTTYLPSLPRFPRLPLVVAGLLALAACAPLPSASPVYAPTTLDPAVDTPALSPDQAARNFVTVVGRMEPVIVAQCLKRSRGANCDYQIVVDDRPGQSPNAFQTLDETGRPVIAFNLPLIAEVRNADELAFVMGHEAAHHIAGHIPRQQQTASTGAILLGGLAAAYGYDEATVRSAQNIGAGIAGRAYAKNYELEADRLGTVIAWEAGFDPERGAMFFSRLPDPGNRFMGSHPPNAARIEVVRRTIADLRAGRPI